MESINVISDSESRAQSKGQTKKFFLWGFLLLILILVATYFIWKNSGSGQWSLELDKDGIQVYSMKTPGSTLKKFKAVKIADYTVSHLVAGMLDETVETCAKWIPGCNSVEHIEPWNPQTLSNTLLWKVELFSFLSPVELMVHAQYSQDKQSNEAFIRFTVLPDLTPKNACCDRLRHMDNTWRYTPLENGKVQIEFVQDFAMGEMLNGLMPDTLFSLFGPYLMYDFFANDLPRVLDNDKYRTAKLDYVAQ